MTTSVKAGAVQRHEGWLARWRAFATTHPRRIGAAKFLGLLFIFSFVAWRRLDPDFGWHLRTGDFIRAHGIPAHDIFTYTARQFPWIDHEWGNDVVLSWLYAWGGYNLAALAYGALWAGGLLIGNVRTRVSVLFMAAVAVAPYAGIRPVAWTVLLLAATFKILESSRTKLAWLLPPIFTAWANLHAGFVIGLAMVTFYALYRRRVALLGVLAACVLATFANAYGLRLYVEVARTLFDPALHTEVVEWAPFVFNTGPMIFIVFWIAGRVMFGGRGLKNWLRPSSLLLLAAFSATRNVPLFVVAATRDIDKSFTKLRQSLPARFNAAARRTAIGVMVLFCLVLLYGAQASSWELRHGRDEAYPAAAVAYLHMHGCGGGNLLDDYSYGGYLIWKLPFMPVYIDGRMPSWRAPDGKTYYAHYIALLKSKTEYRAYNIRCSVLRKDNVNVGFIQTLRKDGWHVAVETPSYVLQIAPQ